MDKRPKRRKCKDNPYELIKEETKYYIKFKDSSNQIKVVEVNEAIYKTFDNFELDDLSFLNEFDRHIEHSEVNENNIFNKLNDKPIELEDYIIQKVTFEELYNAISKLPDIQQRRIKMYYFEEMTEQEIAEKEHTTQQSVHIILKRAIDNLKKLLKN